MDALVVRDLKRVVIDGVEPRVVLGWLLHGPESSPDGAVALEA